MYTYKRKKIKNAIIIVISISIFIIVMYVIINMYTKIETYERSKVEAKKVTTNLEIEEKLFNISDIIKNVNKSVVGISKIRDMGNSIFTKDGVENLGLGTGVIVSENGYILTNEHVSGKKYSKCYVTLENGEICNGDVVWADEEIDLAIVKIMKSGLNVISFGDSDLINIGEKVYAIGNPIGYEFQRTVTSGIVSAMDRVVNFNENEKEIYMSNLIQTDATINPGNSGGPLINELGEVIGINTIKITSAEAIGFAIPINIAKPIIKSFVENGSFEEGTIGIFAYDKNIKNYLEPNSDTSEGIYVEQVKVNSPGYEAKLLKGDIITKIDDKSINRMCELREYIYSKKPGEKVTLEVKRNNKTRKIEIFLIKK